jgi:hypothetical protein
MHGGWQLFSPTLLVEVERSLLKRWVALYTLARVWMREQREKHTQVRGFLLLFIFAPSLYLIRFDRDRPSRLCDAITLGRSSL